MVERSTLPDSVVLFNRFNPFNPLALCPLSYSADAGKRGTNKP